ncbi:sulfite exporter TauE/SafE family protein [Magnetospirillum sulfuroxidans]|uniref:Probable membrane transporter protein n=1 Tax=Magnetospirillum sulfuroxidans TaxID=611300 RepID=A0ABS5IC40_9PROT|nr:sulfite exporter TauE/SafE family protein [Magnetospirillum sulfuroxidans]MBR9971727.1 sulfite exporter TauE/SafE family protein [Magnetospirillum sulfuroxidans]
MDIALILSIFVLAGAVKGISGLGLPTIGIALLGLMFSPAEAAALLVAPSLLTNVWQAWGGGASLMLLARRLWPLLAGIVAGTALGGALAVDAAFARLILAEVLMLYAMLGLLDFSPRMAPWAEPVLAPLSGLAAGALAAVTGVFVIPVVPYLQALRLERDHLVQALGLCFTVSTLALGLMLAEHGALALPQLGLSLWATLPAVLGMMLGGKIRRRIPPLIFRRGFFVFLFAIGVHLLLS